MSKYGWCYGIVLDGNFCEQTCKRRDDCAYYSVDLFRRFSMEELADEPLMNEPGQECRYFVRRKEREEQLQDYSMLDLLVK